jgi:hypothetical protein
VTHVEHETITDPVAYFREHPEFHECRRYGHRFRPTHPGYLIEGSVRRPIVYYQKLRCKNECGLTAEDLFSTDGNYDRIGNRRIFYSDCPEYQAHGTRITRGDARVFAAKSEGVRKGEALRRGITQAA